MSDHLLVAVLGNRDAGKTHTWNSLFGGTVRTGTQERRLWLSETEWVNVFLVSGSPEERKEYVGQIIGDLRPRIVLCSMQYRYGVHDTIDYFVEQDYQLFVHWLNPGFSDRRQYDDNLGLVAHILRQNSMLGVRNGEIEASERVGEIRDFVRGWAGSRGLIERS